MSDFFSAIHIAGSGMSAQRARMNVVSSNLANANTTRTAEGGPYRRKDPVFRAVPLRENFAAELDEWMGDNAHAVQVVRVIEDTTPPRRVYDPEHPDADDGGYSEGNQAAHTGALRQASQ